MGSLQKTYGTSDYGRLIKHWELVIIHVDDVCHLQPPLKHSTARTYITYKPEIKTRKESLEMEGVINDCSFEYSYDRCADENCFNCLVCCEHAQSDCPSESSW